MTNQEFFDSLKDGEQFAIDEMLPDGFYTKGFATFRGELIGVSMDERGNVDTLKSIVRFPLGPCVLSRYRPKDAFPAMPTKSEMKEAIDLASYCSEGLSRVIRSMAMVVAICDDDPNSANGWLLNLFWDDSLDDLKKVMAKLHNDAVARTGKK